MIRLAHEKPELRPHLLPLLTRQATSIAETMMSRELAKLNSMTQDMVKLPDVMAGLVTQAGKGDPSAAQEFETLHARVVELGNALIESGTSMSRMADSIEDQPNNKKFAVTKVLLIFSVGDYRRAMAKYLRKQPPLPADRLRLLRPLVAMAGKIREAADSLYDSIWRFHR